MLDIRSILCSAGLMTAMFLQGCGNEGNIARTQPATGHLSATSDSTPIATLLHTASTSAPGWLSALCSSDESERFGAIKEATERFSSLSLAQLEGVLAEVVKSGNVSTLLFAATQAKAPIFYELSSPQIEALKDLPGAFPNLPAYFGAVQPDKGFLELKKLYIARPDMSLPILRAVGTTQLLEAKHWLVLEAVNLKKSGKDAYPVMAGLSRCAGDIALSGEELGQLFELGLNREELLLLAKAPVKLNKDDLGALMSKGGAAAAFGQEQLLRNPLANAELLCDRISDLLNQGKLQEATVMLNSDKVRSIEDAAFLERLAVLSQRLSDIENSRQK